MSEKAVVDLNLPLERVASGKVREVYALDDERLLFVASDRISAYDVVMAQGIPGKGRVLTGLSLFWFDLLGHICPNHLLAAEPESLPDVVRNRPELNGRSMVVRKLEMLPVEFVVRGYLAGSGWAEYQKAGSVCGVPLPSGLQQASKLPEPIFTPATKAVEGHDENISEDVAADLVGPAVLKEAKGYAIAVYRAAAEHASARGIILADTKFEFGMHDGKVTLADEVLTPDSSRFWPAASWSVGSNPPSFDKQYLRDWLDASGWDHEPPPPDLPEEVILATASRYQEAFDVLTAEPAGDR